MLRLLDWSVKLLRVLSVHACVSVVQPTISFPSQIECVCIFKKDETECVQCVDFLNVDVFAHDLGYLRVVFGKCALHCL